MHYIAVLFLALTIQGCGNGGGDESASSQGVSARRANAGSGSENIDLTATVDSSAEIDLAWSSGAGAQIAGRYRILRDGSRIATLSDITSFEDTGVHASTSYAYVVELIDGSGAILSRSREVKATTPIADSTAPMVSSISTEDSGPVAVNSSITMDFTAAMSKSTVNAETFKVRSRSGKPVSGAVSVNGNTATFTPDAPLPAATVHTATITTGATDTAGNAMAAEFATTFATAAVTDTTPPTVSSIYPANTSAGVATNSSIAVEFSEPMSITTLTSATFKLRETLSGTAIAGTVRVTSTTATFTPAAILARNTQYTATLAAGVLDAAGNALAGDFNWTFSTGASGDVTIPLVIGRNPGSGDTNAAVNTSVQVNFSEFMKSSTITTASFRLANTASGAAVSGTVRSFVTCSCALFVPSSDLTANTSYTATVTTTARDVAGNRLPANSTWTFTTGDTPDTTPPTISATSPKNLATAVVLNSPLSATFSEPMKNSTLSTTSVTLKKSSNGAAVNGAISIVGNAVTFTPSVPLAGSTQYTATISTAAMDASGNALAAGYSWSFTTAAAAASGSSGNTASLTWDAVNLANLGGYRIYYGTAPGTYSQPAGSGLNVGKATTYSLTGLSPGSRYYFAVSVFDATGKESEYSNEVTKVIP